MSTWYHHDYPQSNPTDFSTLEVAPQPNRPDESFKEMQSPTGLEPVHLKRGNLAARYGQFDTPEAVAQPSPSLSPPILQSPYPPASLGGSFGALITEKALESNKPKPRRICGLRARNSWFILVLIVLTIAIVVGLSVGLTVGRDQSHHKKGKGGNSGNSTLAPPATKGVSNNSSLASIAFNDTFGLLRYRIYFQDDTDMIKESSWNASTKLWQISNTAIGQAKSKSPLAAIVTGPPSYAFQINIYAISESGLLIAWVSVDTDFASTNTTFTPGPISNQGIVPATSSNLAAVWDRGCDQCSTVLNVVYEGDNGQIQYGNLTTGGWQWTVLAAAPIVGTGLALDVRYLTNGARDIMLYYQIPGANLVPALYNGTSGQWQYREDNPLSPIAKNAPIAAFSHGWNADGSSHLEEVLSSGNSGTTYDLYNGQSGGWATQQKAQVMAFVQNYSSLAANADAHAYAMQGGVISEFEMTSGGGWASFGNVTTS